MSAALPRRDFARDLERLTRAARRGRAISLATARSLVAAPVAWERWRDAFNALHHAEPAVEARLARALHSAARARKEPLLAGRFLLLEGRGLLRAGLPGLAGERLAQAADALRRVHEHERAAQASVAAVDAWAHAGRLKEALSLAARTERRLRRPQLASWRDFLAINRANAWRLAGEVERAERTYEVVARRLDARGDAATATIARLNAGVARLEGGDADGAHLAFELAEAAFHAQKRPEMAREARYNAACADVRRGRLGTAVRTLEALAVEHASAGAERGVGLCRMDLADALLRAGDAPAAEQEARAASLAFGRAGALAEALEATCVQIAVVARRDPRAAAGLAARARSRAQRLGRKALAQRFRLIELDVETSQGRLPAAASLRALARDARREGQHELAAQAGLLEAAALLRRGRGSAALARLHALGRAKLPLRLATARLTLEAEALAAQGRVAPALRRLERATSLLEPLLGNLPGGWLRASFLLEHLDPWLARIDLLLERGLPADRRAAAGLLDRLGERRFRALGRPRADDARLTRARGKLEALYDRLGRGQGPTRGLASDEGPLLLARAARLERELTQLLRERERREREGARAEVPEEAHAPACDTATLHLWRRGDRVQGALRRADGEVEHWLAGDALEMAAEAQRLAFHARRSLLAGVGAASRPRVDASGFAVAEPPAPGWHAHEAFERGREALAATCLGPLRDRPLPERVAVTVDPALPDLPLEILPVRGTLLSAATRLVRVPSVRVGAEHRERGVGVTWVALGEADLPGVGAEGAAMAASAEILTGAAANRGALRTALSERARVHVAGHGLDGGACPALGGVRLHDGWFGAADLPERVSADLVVLSACRSGRVVGLGALAWGGLPTSLLALGARHVVWTADDVDDAATATLTAHLHDELQAGALVPVAFGRALARTAHRLGSPAALLPFRLSGIHP